MGFNRKGFNDFIREEFSYDGTTQRMIDNLVEYGMKHLDNFDGQLVDFIQSVIDDPTIDEIKRFEIKEEKVMNYNETRKMIENMATENYEDFIKAIISFEKGINDKEALDTIYDDYTANDSLTLLNEEFDIRAHALICFLALLLHRVLRMRLRASHQALSPERALEIARRIQFHQVTLHRQHTASGLTSLTPEQRQLFAAIDLPEPAARHL